MSSLRIEKNLARHFAEADGEKIAKVGRFSFNRCCDVKVFIGSFFLSRDAIFYVEFSILVCSYISWPNKTKMLI